MCPICDHVYTRRLVRRGSVMFADGPIPTLRTTFFHACTWCVDRLAQTDRLRIA